VVEGVLVDLVMTEATMSSRESPGIKIGTRKRVIERDPTTTTPTAQDFRGSREERPRYEQQRINPNKRQFDDRERADWDKMSDGLTSRINGTGREKSHGRQEKARQI
jgi:hypothetical protein